MYTSAVLICRLLVRTAVNPCKYAIHVCSNSLSHIEGIWFWIYKLLTAGLSKQSVKLAKLIMSLVYLYNVYLVIVWPFYQVTRQLLTLASPSQPYCYFTLFSNVVLLSWRDTSQSLFRTNESILLHLLCTFRKIKYKKQSAANCVGHIFSNVWHSLQSIDVHLFQIAVQRFTEYMFSFAAYVNPTK